MSENKKVLNDEELENVNGGYKVTVNGEDYIYLNDGDCYGDDIWKLKVIGNYSFPANEVHQIHVHSIINGVHIDETIKSSCNIFDDYYYKGYNKW